MIFKVFPVFELEVYETREKRLHHLRERLAIESKCLAVSDDAFVEFNLQVIRRFTFKPNQRVSELPFEGRK